MFTTQTVDLGSATLEISVVAGTVLGKETTNKTTVMGNANYVDTLNFRTDSFQVRQADGSVRALELFNSPFGVMPGNEVAFIIGRKLKEGRVFVYPESAGVIAAYNKTTDRKIVFDAELNDVIRGNSRKVSWGFVLISIITIWLALTAGRTPSMGWLATGAVLLFLSINGVKRAGLRIRRSRDATEELLNRVVGEKALFANPAEVASVAPAAG